MPVIYGDENIAIDALPIPLAAVSKNPHHVVLRHNHLKTKMLDNKKTSLHAIDNKVVKLGGTGLEPVASCVSSRRSNQLS